MGLRRRLILPLGLIAGAASVAAIHRARRQAVPVDGGTLIADTSAYDRLAGWLLGRFYAGVANDVAATVAPDARVLDVGCGPGHLLERLANLGLRVTGVDLDAAMVARAALRLGDEAEVVMADVAALPFPDASFDLVVSTLSMHHWADRAAGVTEVARVLRPGGRAIVFDFGGARVPLHGHVEGPGHHFEGSPLRVTSDAPWRWPGPVSLMRRVEASLAV